MINHKLRKIFSLEYIPKNVSAFVFAIMHRSVRKKVEKVADSVINSGDSNYIKKSSKRVENRIWFFWWDESNMSTLVKYNFELLNNIPNVNVQLLTSDNIGEFLHFEDAIYQALQRGELTIQLFSDLVRMSLLYEYGGIWVDSTILTVSKNFNLEWFESDIFTIRHSDEFNGKFVPAGRWTVYLIGGQAGKKYFRFASLMIQHYIINDMKIPDYYLLDYLLDFAYTRNIGGFADDLDLVPITNLSVETLVKIQDDLYNVQNDPRRDGTAFFKLSNRKAPSNAVENSFYNVIVRNETEGREV